MRRLVLAAFAALFAMNAWGAPLKFYVLAPEHLAGDLSVMSLEPSNVITADTLQLTLQQYDTGAIPATELFPGLVIQGTGAFVVGSSQSAADLLVPDSFSGTAFVVPHITGQHKYFFLSPTGTASVTVRLGANTYNLQALQGVVNEFDAGSDNAIAGRVTSDQPIVLAHVAYVSGVPQDAYPVPPAATEIVGIRSQNSVVATATDGTSVTAYAHDGTSATYNINAGQKATVAVGASTNQGQGAAIRLVSNYPIAAVQYDDGDGSDMTGFWATARFGRRIGIPVGAQYLAVACTQANVSVTLYKGATNPETQICSGNGNSPGKAYFGASTSGPNVTSGWYVISSQPIYLMYEAATPEDEDNNLGLTPPAGPAAPTLNAVTSPTTNNPQTVTGTSGANQSVRLYVNGKLRATATANGSGAFTLSAELIDGNNVLYATAVVSGDESDPSPSVSVTYNNTVSRTQSGSIAGYVVWTPGNPALPYTITANLTVAAGGKLVLQPGTTLKFANGTLLTATGELKVVGTPGNPVTITSSAASPVRGSWQGVLINGGASSLVEYAVIEYTATGVNVAAVTATVRSSTIRYFLNNGVYVSGAGASGTLMQNNLIDNLNDTGDCIETNASSPTIKGNTLTNCANGVHVVGAAAPAVNSNNIITANDYGITANGNSGVSTLPVVTGNQIFANDVDDYRVTGYSTSGSGVKLNAANNWWGTTVPTTISENIYDLTNSYTSTSLPTVDYSGYLDAPNGSPVPGNYLIGKLTAATTTLTTGTTYDVLGVLFVNSGKTLAIQPGAIVRFHGNAFLVVDGTLTAQGTTGNLAIFTSGRTTPARGDWPGVLLRTAGSLIDFARIEYAATGVQVIGVTATVRNSTIQLFASGTGSGIYVNGSGASGSLIATNLIDNSNDSGRCIWVQSSAPTIQGNTLTNCDRGIYVYGAANPTLNGGNVIISNDDGIYVDGNNSNTPLPLINGNQIHSNDNDDFLTTGFAIGAQSLKLNATGNWWGTTDPTLISGNIYDLTDTPTSTRNPTVDFSGFLDGPSGSPVPGNQLIGPFTATSAVLTGGATYEVLGALWVQAGKSLTIPAGTTLKFYTANSQLIVNGTLTIQGSAGNLARLKSGRAVPARGDWGGIAINVAGTTIEYADIQWASTAITVNNVAATIRYNQIGNFSSTPASGIYVTQSGSSGTLIANNVIDNGNDSGNCIWVQSSAPTIQGNTLTNCDKGVHLLNTASATINAGNIITGNDHGIYVDGNDSYTPLPVVNANQIHSNDVENFYTRSYAIGAQNLKLNATGNWWGSANPAIISANIYDLTDSYTSTRLPTVDYSGFLDGPNGSPVPGNQLIGNLPAGSTNLIAGATYNMLGTVTVPAGATLVIPAGTRMHFYVPASYLAVKGTLQIQGTSGNMAVFTSGNYPKVRGDWQGIRIESPSTGSTIDYAVIEYANRNIELLNANALIRDCTIRNHEEAGIYATGATSATEIRRNYIENYDRTRTGIWLIASSPIIDGNRVHRNDVGIRISGNSTPQITANIISDNDNGINLVGDGSNSATSNPRPVITGNDIFGNTNYQLQVYNYGSASPIVINATGNWWGTSTPQAGTQIKFTSGSPASTANFSSPAMSPLNGTAIAGMSLSFDVFSPNADSIQDTTTLTATLSQSASWTTTLRNSANTAVRTYTGTGAAISVAWDGMDGSSVVQPDGNYSFEVTVPGSPSPQIVGYRLTQIDNTFPTLTITTPAAAATLVNSTIVSVAGTAADLNFVSYTLEYGAGPAPTSWTAISSGTAALVSATLGAWITNAIDGSIALNGLYTLRLRSTDTGGNAGVHSQSVTLDNLTGSGITQSVAQIQPLTGEQVSFNFTLSGPGTATVDIYPDLGGASVRQISQIFGSGGAKSLIWDGKNSAGAYVTDEAYRWVLTLSDATHTTVYDPPDPGSAGSNSGTVDPAFNANVNDFLKMNNTLSDAKARVRMEITGCVAAPHNPYNWVPFVQGTHLLMWDGRDAAGSLVSGSCSILIDVPDPLRPFSVIVKGTGPVITGTRPSPDLEVGGEPNIVVHSFDQIGRFTYRLSLDSTVTVRLLPPEITSFTDPSAITLVNSVVQPAQSGGQPANYTVEWKGHDGIDTNSIQVSTEGTYTIAIQAVSTLTGRTTLYRGALQLYQ